LPCVASDVGYILVKHVDIVASLSKLKTVAFVECVMKVFPNRFITIKNTNIVLATSTLITRAFKIVTF